MTVQVLPGEVLVTSKLGRQYILSEKDSLLRVRLQAGPYQKRNLLTMRQLVSEAGVIIDVGMNCGMNMVEYATWAKQVIGFEPVPSYFSRAERNLQLAREARGLRSWWPGTNGDIVAAVTLHNCAVGAVDGQMVMSRRYSAPGQDHMLATHTLEGHKTSQITVRMHTLDSLDYEDVSAVKVDVEGYEFEVLRGAEQLVRQYRPVFQLEIMPEHLQRFGVIPQDIYTWFRQRDYTPLLPGGQLLVEPEYRYRPRMSDRFFVPNEGLHPAGPYGFSLYYSER